MSEHQDDAAPAGLATTTAAVANAEATDDPTAATVAEQPATEDDWLAAPSPGDEPAEAASGETAAQDAAETALAPAVERDAEVAAPEQEAEHEPAATVDERVETVLGTVRVSLARGGRNVHMRLYGPLNDHLRALGPLRVEPGAYRNGEIAMSLVGQGRGRAVEEKGDHCAVEYRADADVAALLAERYGRGRPVHADAVLTIRIREPRPRPPKPPAASPAVAQPDPVQAPAESIDVWVTDGRRFAIVRCAPGTVSLATAEAERKLGGTFWRRCAGRDDEPVERARAAGEFAELSI